MSHFTHMNESRYTYEGVTSHIRTSHVTHINVCMSMYTYAYIYIYAHTDYGAGSVPACVTDE